MPQLQSKIYWGILIKLIIMYDTNIQKNQKEVQMVELADYYDSFSQHLRIRCSALSEHRGVSFWGDTTYSEDAPCLLVESLLALTGR